MQKRCYSEQEIEKLETHIASKSLRDATIFRIGLDTNLSVSDVLSLKTTDVIQLGDIKSALQIKTKKGTLRDVLLSEKSLDLLDYYTCQLLDEEGDFYYLFESRSNKGEPISNSHWNRIIKNYCKEIGIENRTNHEGIPPQTESTFSSQLEKKLNVLQKILNPKNHSISLNSKQEILCSLKSLLKNGTYNNHDLTYPVA